MTQEQIKNAPHYDSTQVMERAEEKALHLHYGRNGYWEKALVKTS